MSGTTCIIYEWEVMPSGTTAYSLADITNVPVIQTFSYPNLTTAATYSPLVAQSEMSRTYNMRLASYNKILGTNKTYSLVPFTVYHKCYNMKLDQTLPGTDMEYALKTSSDILIIPRFTADLDCLLTLKFTFVNETKDVKTGIVTTTLTPLVFPNPYLDFSANTYQFFVKGHSQAIDFIGSHRILMEAKMTHGLASASQWVNITVNCAMDKIKPDETDLADLLNKIMKPYQYTVGDTKLRISFRDFVPIPLYCGIPIDYTFRLQSGDPLPKIFTADNFIFTRGGYIDVFTSTRKVISDTRYTILITGEVPQDNPPLTGVPFLTSTMVLPLEFIIPNTGPPTLKSNPPDIRLKVNEVGVIKFSAMSDPDWEDLASL